VRSTNPESITPVSVSGVERDRRAYGFRACAKWRIPE
jgi:hypothetical protein